MKKWVWILIILIIIIVVIIGFFILTKGGSSVGTGGSPAEIPTPPAIPD